MRGRFGGGGRVAFSGLMCGAGRLAECSGVRKIVVHLGVACRVQFGVHFRGRRLGIVGGALERDQKARPLVAHCAHLPLKLFSPRALIIELEGQGKESARWGVDILSTVSNEAEGWEEKGMGGGVGGSAGHGAADFTWDMLEVRRSENSFRRDSESCAAVIQTKWKWRPSRSRLRGRESSRQRVIEVQRHNPD